MSKRAAAWILVVAVASPIGCQKQTPPADVSNAPWLDPKAQMEGLKNSDYRIRGISAFNLGNMGAKAAEALPELARLAASDPQPKVRENACEALEKIKAARHSGD
jgi:HEAT repeats